MNCDDKHPNLLRRQQFTVSTEEEEEWAEYQRLLGEFEKGIRFVLRRTVDSDVMQDLVSECFAQYFQTCGQWEPQSFGKDAAKRWLRANFKEDTLETSEGETKKWVAKAPAVTSLIKQNDEGEEYNTVDYVAFDAVEPEGWMGKEKPLDPFMPANYSLFRATADYEICLLYQERKLNHSNRFTRAESTAYESALNRLRRAAKQ